MTTSSLSAQLATIYDPTQAPDVQYLRQDSKLRESILFDPRDAADLDNDEIFALGLAGFTELCSLCGRFQQYEEDFFSQHAKLVRRTDLTREENEHISQRLSELLPLLSCFYLQDCGLKALEWLIRNFHVHLMDMDAFIGGFLLYHETPLFPKALSILGGMTDHEWDDSNARNKWLFLRQIRKQKGNLSRSFLVKRCLADFGFVQFVEKLHSRFLDLSCKYDSIVSNWVSFTTVLIMEYFHAIPSPSIPDNVLLYFVPLIIEALNRTKSYFSSYLMILTQLCCKSQLSKDAVYQLLTILLSQPLQPKEQIILACIVLVESQDCIEGGDEKLNEYFRALTQHQDFVFAFLQQKSSVKFENLFVVYCVSSDNCALLSEYLKVVVPQRNRLLEFVSLGSEKCQLMLSSYCQSSSSENSVKSSVGDTDIFQSALQEGIFHFIQVFHSMQTVADQRQLISALLQNIELFLRKDNISYLVHFAFQLLIVNDSEIRSIALQILSRLTESDTKFSKLLATVASLSDQIKSSSKVIIDEFSLLTKAMPNYCEFLFSFPLNQKYPICCYSTLLLTSKCPFSIGKVQLVCSLLEGLIENFTFEIPINLVLDELLLSNLSFLAEQPKLITKLLVLFEPLLLNCNARVIQLCNLVWKQIPKYQMTMFNWLLLNFARQSSLLAHFPQIVPSLGLLEVLFEEIVGSFAENGHAAKKKKQPESVQNLLLLQGTFDYLLFHSNKIDEKLNLFLVAGSFEILSHLLSFSDSSFDYPKQIILTLLISLISSPKNHHQLASNEDSVRVDVLVNCLRSNSNSQLQNLCFSCIGKIATVIPQRTLDCIIPLFTFMGNSVMRRDDSSSLNVVLQAIREIIPVVLANPSVNALELLCVFVSALDHVPSHRIQSIFGELLKCLSNEKLSLSYWLDMTVWICVLQHVTDSKSSKIPIDAITDLCGLFSVPLLLESLHYGMKRMLEMGNYDSKKFLSFLNTDSSCKAIKSQDHILQIRSFIGQIYRNVLKDPETISKANSAESQSIRESFIPELIEMLLSSFNIFGKEKMIYSEIFSLVNLKYISLAEFVAATQRLLANNSIMLQRKGLQLLNEKIQHVSLNDAFTEMAVKISNECLSSTPSLQCHLLAVDIIAKKFSGERQNEFYGIASKLVALLQDSSIGIETRVTVIVCLGSFIANLPMKMIGWISKYAPNLIETLSLLMSASESSLHLFIPSVLNSLLAMIKHQGSFTGPYLASILTVVLSLQQKQLKGTDNVLSEIFAAIPSAIEPHLLLPVLLSLPSNTLVLKLLSESSKGINRDLLVSLLPLYQKFIFSNVEFINSVEFVAFLRSFVLKMNSQLFAQFFQSLVDWTVGEKKKRFGYLAQFSIHFFTILNHFFADYFVSIASFLLAHSYDNETDLPLVLEGFKSIFTLSKEIPTKDWIKADFIPFLVGKFREGKNCTLEQLIECSLSFGKSVEISSELWHSLHESLISSLNDSSSGKIVFCQTMSRFFECWNEEYLVFLPTLLPILAELLEDPDEQVESQARELSLSIEKYLGEPILKYLE